MLGGGTGDQFATFEFCGDSAAITTGVASSRILGPITLPIATTCPSSPRSPLLTKLALPGASSIGNVTLQGNGRCVCSWPFFSSSTGAMSDWVLFRGRGKSNFGVRSVLDDPRSIHHLILESTGGGSPP